MREVYERRATPPDWPRPSAIISRVIDAPTGLLAGPQCPASDAYTEYFLPGTEPTTACAPRAFVPRPKSP
jgi:hypothetical protein